jgi:hypothetical protein
MKRAAFSRFDARAFSRSHPVFTERKGFRQVVFDQESRGKGDDLGKFVLSKSLGP